MEKAKKHLTVILQGNKLETAFEGNWSGNDLRVVMTHLPKRYRLFIRDLRRKLAKPREVMPKDQTIQPETSTVWGHNYPTKQEVKNV